MNNQAPNVETLEASNVITSDPYLPSAADVHNDATIGTTYDEDDNIQYWYNMSYNRSTEVASGDPTSFYVHSKSETHACLCHTIRLSYYLFGQQL